MEAGRRGKGRGRVGDGSGTGREPPGARPSAGLPADFVTSLYCCHWQALIMTPAPVPTQATVVRRCEPVVQCLIFIIPSKHLSLRLPEAIFSRIKMLRTLCCFSVWMLGIRIVNFIITHSRDTIKTQSNPRLHGKSYQLGLEIVDPPLYG